MQQSLVRNPAMALLGQVLGLVSVAFGVTAVAGFFAKDLPYGIALIIMLCSLPMVIAISFVRRNEALSLICYYGMAACFGAGLGPVINQYAKTGRSDIVIQAAGLTALGMAVIGIIAWTSSFDFRRLQGLGVLALGGLVIVGLIGLFVHFLSPTIYAWATLAVFAIIIPADFARIRAGGDGQSAIQMATAIYLDALNVFLAILRILSKKD
jgi:modulator of FtsH protease